MADITQNASSGLTTPWEGSRGFPDAYKYPNPFMDIASAYIPTNINDAFTWAEYLMMTVPPFMAVINRVVSYFLTSVEINDVADDVREKYEEVFDKDLHIIQKLQDIGKDYFCFGGDTRVVTDTGVFPIRELAGRTVKVLAIDGQWRSAKFRSFGRQKTTKVVFGNGTECRVTADHRWFRKCNGKKSEYVQCTTEELKKTNRIPVLIVPRPEKNADYRLGVLHGLVFGLREKPLYYEADFLNQYKRTTGLEETPSMKNLPKNVSRSYWYGFFGGMATVAGFFQPKANSFFLTSNDRKKLEGVREGMIQLGLVPKSIVKRKIWADYERYYMPFRISNLLEDDFLCQDQKDTYRQSKRLKARIATSISKMGKRWTEEEVFCCVEPVTHTFALEGGLITGNCYGNSFVSVYLPFDRYLQCPDCGNQVHISKIKYKFNSEKGEFMCRCPKCKKGEVAFKRVDRRSRDTSKIKVNRWDPKRIKLKVNDITGEIKYYYKLDPRFVERVRKGDPFYINNVSWGFIETCLGAINKDDSTEHLFEFDTDKIYHLRDANFAGLSEKIKGWGIPPILPYFKLAYYIQLMRRYDEAIALDFIVPFRILYPQGSAPGGQDPLTMVSMQTFIAAMSSMVEKKRMNMTSIEVAPWAIGYEMIGGEAKQLAPKESIQEATQELLNSMGFPQELFAGTLSLQAAPVALRLFEREWNPFVSGINDILQWITDEVSKYMQWDPVEVHLTPVTLADDLEKKGIQMQAAAGQDISKQTAYRSIGIDYLDEQRRIIKEQQDIQKMQEKAMADAQAQQANGAMGGGGDGGAEGGGGESGMNGPGGQVGATPGDVFQQAQQIAQQLIAENNPTHTRQMLASIKQTNPTLWAQVKGQLQDQRQQLASQGQQLMIQQMQQGG